MGGESLQLILGEVADTRSNRVVRAMKVREIIRQIEADGWYLVRVEEDHRQYKHPSKSGRVTIAGKRSD